MKMAFLDEIDEELRKIYQTYKNKRIIVYGAGGYGKRVIRLMVRYKLKNNRVAICDSDSRKWNHEIEGIQVCNIEDVDFDDHTMAIIASEYKEEIYKILKKYPIEIYKETPYQKFMEEKMSMYVFKQEKENNVGFNLKWFDEWNDIYLDKEKETIELLNDAKSKSIIRNRVDFYKSGDIKYICNIDVSKEEYFDREILRLTQEEVFIDCGAYRGDTIVAFLKAVDKYKRVYAFEPDINNYRILKEAFGDKEDILLYDYGVGEKNDVVCFNTKKNMWSCVDEYGDDEIEIRRLDDIIQEKVTMIKMDIEGSELSALKGAEEIIKKYQPKLAICIYHRVEDIIAIPKYLSEIVPQYRFYVRQYDDTLFQTVLYAVI